MGTQTPASPQDAAGTGSGAHTAPKGANLSGMDSGDLIEIIRKQPIDETFDRLDVGPGGLSGDEAARRQTRFGKNLIESGKKRSPVARVSVQLHPPHGDSAVGGGHHRVSRGAARAGLRRVARQHHQRRLQLLAGISRKPGDRGR